MNRQWQSLFQWLSILLLRFNAILLRDSFATSKWHIATPVVSVILTFDFVSLLAMPERQIVVIGPNNNSIVCIVWCRSAVKIRSGRKVVDGSNIQLVAGKKSVFKRSGLRRSDLRGRKTFYIENGANCQCGALTSGQLASSLKPSPKLFHATCLILRY